MNNLKRILLQMAMILAVAKICPAQSLTPEPLIVSDVVSITSFPGLTRSAAVDRDTRKVRILDVPVDPMGFDNICWWHHIQWTPEGRWFLVKRSSEDRQTAIGRTQTSKSAVAEYTSPAETDTTKSGGAE